MARASRQEVARRKEAVLEYLKWYEKTAIAVPRLKLVAAAIGLQAESSAMRYVDWLVEHSFVEKRGDGRFPELIVIGEPRIPVVLANERIDPSEPLLDERRIVETMRGVLAEAFEPLPDFMAVIRGKGLGTELVAVCRERVLEEGSTALCRHGDEILVGTCMKEAIEVTIPVEAQGRRIDRSDPDLRIEGIVVGNVTARSVPLND